MLKSQEPIECREQTSSSFITSLTDPYLATGVRRNTGDFRRARTKSSLVLPLFLSGVVMAQPAGTFSGWPGSCFSGKAPGFMGLNQVNVRMPSGVVPGPAVPVRLTFITHHPPEQ